MIRRPPRSTPFPTRRSSDLDQYAYTASSTGISQLIPESAFDGGKAKFRERLADPAIKAKIVEEMRKGLKPKGRKDRKSTRLNSSHANISYAVFCLKKKKKTT